VVEATAESFQPIRDLIQKAAGTTQLLAAIQGGPTGRTVRPLEPGDWSPLPLRAAWTHVARESARFDREGERKPATEPPSLIGVHRARTVETAAGGAQIELDGLCTTSWKEFDTEWTVKLEDAEGHVLGSSTTNLVLRAEGGPAPFQIALELPRPNKPSPLLAQRVAVEATVQRMSGAYHGHGMWFRFANKE